MKEVTKSANLTNKKQITGIHVGRREVIQMKRLTSFSMLMLMGVAMSLLVSVKPSFAACPVNMVQVGPICVDKYEASVWSKKPDSSGNPQGTQYDLDYPCSKNDNNCSRGSTKIFAASVPGVKPAGNITWFQAQQACANVGKRLLRNGEWQMAAAGTPDPAFVVGEPPCNIGSGFWSYTGSFPNCVSNWGVFDMVGNRAEWVEDWFQTNSNFDAGSKSVALYGSDGIYGVDEAYPENDRFPAALIRGGRHFDGGNAGVFALFADWSPSLSVSDVGFRCAK